MSTTAELDAIVKKIEDEASTYVHPPWKWDPAPPSEGIAKTLADSYDKLKADLETELTKQFEDIFGMSKENFDSYMANEENFSSDNIPYAVHSLRDSNHECGYSCALILQLTVIDRVQTYIKDTKDVLSKILERELDEEKGKITRRFRKNKSHLNTDSSPQSSCSASEWTLSDCERHAKEVKKIYDHASTWMTTSLKSTYDSQLGYHIQHLITALNNGDSPSIKEWAEALDLRLKESTIAYWFGGMTGDKAEWYVNEVDEYLAKVGHPTNCNFDPLGGFGDSEDDHISDSEDAPGIEKDSKRQ